MTMPMGSRVTVSKAELTVKSGLIHMSLISQGVLLANF